MRQFPCDGCGLCCRAVGHIHMLPSTNGVCDHLKDGRCGIYATRPIICRVGAMFTLAGGNYTWEQWIDVNTQACNTLKSR
jgi:Fe-S-cluster containining protein